MIHVRHPLVLLTLACALGVGLYGYLNPVNNWDLIGYIASALSNQGLNGSALHDATYGDLRAAIPPARFDLLTTNAPYARGVFADPEALEQQLPFYRIRVAYVLAVQALGLVTQTLAQATWLISAASAAALTVLTGLALRNRAPHTSWPISAAMLVTILYLCAVPYLARLSTPDALFSLAAFTALVLLHRARTTALCLIALLPLIRTDAIVLSALVFLLLLTERDRDPRHYGALAISATLYLWVNAAYGNYGHLTLFNFSFIPGQRSPYPATLDPVGDMSVYASVYLRNAVGMLTRRVPWVLLAGLAAAIAERRHAGQFSPTGRVTLLAVAYVLLHFLAFPLGAARHYSFALLICCLQAAHTLAITSKKTTT